MSCEKITEVRGCVRRAARLLVGFSLTKAVVLCRCSHAYHRLLISGHMFTFWLWAPYLLESKIFELEVLICKIFRGEGLNGSRIIYRLLIPV